MKPETVPTRGALKSAARNILLLGATFYTDNLGVSALAAGSLRVLNRQYPGARIAFLDYGRAPRKDIVEIDGQEVEVPLINLRFSRNPLLPNHVIYLIVLAVLMRLSRDRLQGMFTRRNAWLRAILEADMAFAVSGGDSFSDLYGLLRFFYVTLPQFLVTILGKELCLLPQSIGPFRGRVSKQVSRYLMQRASIIFCRERAGVGAIRSLLGLSGQDHKVRFGPDLAFAVEPRAPLHLAVRGAPGANLASRRLVGINISGLLLMGGYDRCNMFGLALDYRDLIQRIIALFIEIRDRNVLLVPHVLGQHDESDAQAILEIHKLLASRYANRLFLLEGNYDQSEIRHVIGSCEFFVASRMHACIAALSQGTPAAAIAYSDKFAGILDGMGLETLIVDPRRMTLQEALQLVDETFKARAAINERLRRTIPAIKQEVLELLAAA
jgi:polysaccharide pyruvyl transferase WcaK-like protein